MDKEKFVLVSLKESKTKKIADVLTNNTSREILDFLSEKKEATEGEIAKELKVPIITVHYNVKALLDSGLIESTQFRWSEKGKKMDIYKVARKYIVIAPRDVSGLKNKLKDIFLIFIVGIVAAGLIHIFTQIKLSGVEQKALSETVSTGVGTNIVAATPEAAGIPLYGLWFLIGVVFVLVLYLLFKRRR